LALLAAGEVVFSAIFLAVGQAGGAIDASYAAGLGLADLGFQEVSIPLE